MEIRTATIERLRDALLASGARRGNVISSAFRTLAREGLFNEEEKVAISRVDAVAETMFLVIAADEQVTDTEFSALRGAIRGLTGDVLSDDIVQILLETYALRLRDDGREARLSAVSAGMEDDEERMNALGLAAAVALADGQVVESESEVISSLQKVFGLTDEQVRVVLGQLAEDD